MATTATALTALATALTACSQDGETPAPARSEPVAPSPATPGADGRRSATLTDIERITGGVTVDLTTKDLPPAPDGFTQADVAAFADRAVDLISRGVSSELDGMTPPQAFEFVFVNQYKPSTDLSRESSQTGAGRYDWEWAWASVFKSAPSGPASFLAARWQVDTIQGTLSDGTRAPQLEVALSTLIEHLVPSADAVLEPVLVKRTVIIRGFKPRGGPSWWPAIGVQAEPLFGGKCAPINGGYLTPAHNPKILRADLKTLKSYLRDPAAVNTTADSQASDIADYVNKYCEP